MAKDYAAAFYNSAAWRKTQAAYMQSQNYICEDCRGVASVVHHIRYITPENIHNPEITLHWDNLKALCMDCHNAEHMGKAARLDGVAFDDAGNLIKRPNAFLVCGEPEGIRQHIAGNRQAGDIVVDASALCAALSGGTGQAGAQIMETAKEMYAHLLQLVAARRGGWRRAFVACTASSEGERQALASELNAEIVQV